MNYQISSKTQAGFLVLALGILIGILALGGVGYWEFNKYIEQNGRDFADAPDGGVAYQIGEIGSGIEIPGKFPTKSVNNGLRSKDTAQIWLGEKVNKELDAKLVNRDQFDDGLALSQEKDKTEVTATFAVNLAKPGILTGTAYLNLFIDLNKDGQWTDDEWVVKNQTVNLAEQKEPLAAYSAQFTSTNLVSELWYRASVSYDQQISGVRGEIAVGEVEDYGPPIFAKEKNYFAKCDPNPTKINHGQSTYLDVVEDPGSDAPVDRYWVKKGTKLKDDAREIKDSGVRSILYQSTQVDGPKRLVIDQVEIQYRFQGWSKKFTTSCDVWVQHYDEGSGPPPGGDDDNGDGDEEKEKEKLKEKVTYTPEGLNPPSTTSSSTSSTDSSTNQPTTQQSSGSESNNQTSTFEGKYETGTEGDYFYINLMVNPTNLAGKTYTGLEIDLNAQNPALPSTINCSVNVNLDGWGNSDWRSTKNNGVHKWFGATQMKQGSKSIMTLYFSNSLTPPSTINMSVLDKDGNPTSVSLTQQ